MRDEVHSYHREPGKLTLRESRFVLPNTTVTETI